MNKSFAVHSYKGGTGKSCIVANLATTLALNGSNVCILEYDFRGPSLHSLFNINNTKYFLNDYLDEYCDIEEAIINVSSMIPSGGNLFVGLADPNPKRITDMLSKTKKWEQHAFEKILKAHNALCNESGVNYLIFDTSPGLQYSSINAIAAADFTIVLSKLDSFDFEGTSRMLLDIYKLLEKKVFLLINQTVPDAKERVQKIVKSLNIPLIGEIPLYPDKSIYLLTEQLMAIQNQDHPFNTEIKRIAEKITNINGE